MFSCQSSRDDICSEWDLKAEGSKVARLKKEENQLHNSENIYIFLQIIRLDAHPVFLSVAPNFSVAEALT